MIPVKFSSCWHSPRGVHSVLCFSSELIVSEGVALDWKCLIFWPPSLLTVISLINIQLNFQQCHQTQNIINFVKIDLTADLLYWTALDCTGAPNKLAIECKRSERKNLNWMRNQNWEQQSCHEMFITAAKGANKQQTDDLALNWTSEAQTGFSSGPVFVSLFFCSQSWFLFYSFYFQTFWPWTSSIN